MNSGITNISETELKILEAAKKVFMVKGMAGARMQEIADAAGINKALLHYYFRSKEKLFEKILDETFANIIPNILNIFTSDIPIFDKIRKFFDEHLSFLQSNMYLPVFILHEINQDPQRFVRLIEKTKISPKKILETQLKKEIENGIIKPISTEDFLTNLLSLSVFTIAAAPMLKSIFKMDDKKLKQFIDNRKKSLAEFVIDAIKK